jgi:hypothetical protein
VCCVPLPCGRVGRCAQSSPLLPSRATTSASTLASPVRGGTRFGVALSGRAHRFLGPLERGEARTAQRVPHSVATRRSAWPQQDDVLQRRAARCNTAQRARTAHRAPHSVSAHRADSTGDAQRCQAAISTHPLSTHTGALRVLTQRQRRRQAMPRAMSALSPARSQPAQAARACGDAREGSQERQRYSRYSR